MRLSWNTLCRYFHLWTFRCPDELDVVLATDVDLHRTRQFLIVLGMRWVSLAIVEPDATSLQMARGVPASNSK